MLSFMVLVVYIFIYCIYLPRVCPNSINCFSLGPCIHFILLHNAVQKSQKDECPFGVFGVRVA